MRIRILGICIAAFFLLTACSTPEKEDSLTFVLVADTHFDPPPLTDQYFHVVNINHLAGNAIWPKEIDGKATNFSCGGKVVDSLSFVAMLGDITDKADSSAMDLFKTMYEQGSGEHQIHYPVYVGLGNHDLNPVVDNKENKRSRIQMMIYYVKERHNGKNAPVPADNFDEKSFAYSWNIKGVHFIQAHMFAGDTSINATSCINWLKNDLKKYASDGKPVVLLQHAGVDNWALGWWSDQQRKALLNALKDYNVIGVFVGHTHVALNIRWENIDVFEVNNAWPEVNTGNKDGPASFALVNISNGKLNMVTCKTLDGNGNCTFAAPYFVRADESTRPFGK
jgi:cytolysin (calcineurin-like family phosphatase)